MLEETRAGPSPQVGRFPADDEGFDVVPAVPVGGVRDPLLELSEKVVEHTDCACLALARERAEAALRESEYINPKTGQLAGEKLRRMIRRLTLEEADAEVLLGMLHKIGWKLAHNKKTKA